MEAAAENKKVMAENIKYYMALKGVTKQQLCNDLGFKYTTFVDWFNAVTYPRIGKVEAMAQYFGCEKSDLIEDRNQGMGEEGNDLPESVRKVIQFAHTVPEHKADLVLRVMQSILEEN